MRLGCRWLCGAQRGRMLGRGGGGVGGGGVLPFKQPFTPSIIPHFIFTSAEEDKGRGVFSKVRGRGGVKCGVCQAFLNNAGAWLRGASHGVLSFPRENFLFLILKKNDEIISAPRSTKSLGFFRFQLVFLPHATSSVQ